MQIIIVGCGKVGYTLVQQLSGEEHSIVVVDENPDRVKTITDELDALGIIGNGISYRTLQDAGIQSADLLIAVTGSDEQNLLCCLIAKKAGHCKTIARVRNPIYYDEIGFLRREFELAMIINPEYAAANEIARIFQFPSAFKIDTFSKGHVELLHFHISKDSPLNGDTIFNIRNNMHCNILVCTVMRGEHVIIPNGDFTFREGDTVGIVANRQDAIAFFKKIGLMTSRVSNALIAGGGKISYYLAQNLIKSGIDTTIIELDFNRCEQLSELLPQATIICGNATDQNLLEQEGLERFQGFAALTGLDEENILLALFAKERSKAKVITKINRINFTSVINNLDLDSIINPQVITADYIIKYARSMSNSLNSDVENLYKLEDGKAEALEFLIKEDSAVTNVPLQDLKMRKNTLICSIYRGGNVIVPSGQDRIQVGDSVIVVMADHRISDIKDILEDK